ncbi:MAG: family 20 glycosylhydrolase [Phycisphaerae bacterium]|nr:family 20 glycosylhydrolase [Phycisphaerae bacterium]
MAIKDERLFAKLLIPPKKVTFQRGYYHFKNSFKSHRDKKIKNSEGYRLKIHPQGIDIYSAAQAGKFYAQQTLDELRVVYGNKLPCCVIEDEPDFKRRGVYLDCSRGKVPKFSTLKKLVVHLARWKINELQLYIENVFTFKKHPAIGKGCSPFKPDEIIKLQKHCKKHHIKLVGSLASFGHMEKILALPKYQHLGELPGYRGFAGGTTLCPTNPDSIKLISELYSEFVPLFEAKDFNVCCDETWDLGEGKSKKLAKKIGKGRLYLDFILKIHRLCKKYNKRMNLWADIVLKYPELLKKLPKDIVLLNWEYEQNGKNIYRTKELAKTGIPFMVCPGTSGWLTHGSRLPNSMANVTNFAKQGRKFGARGLLNTDWGDNGHRNFLGVSLHSFAHSAAQSWNARAVNNSKFTDNFCLHFFSEKTGRLANLIRLLGNTYSICGTNVPNKSWLYFALVEPSKNIEPDGYIYKMNERGLKKIIGQFSDNSIWPKLSKVLGNFEKITYEELKLAARMDCLAAKRALALKNKKYSELPRMKKQIQKMAKDFKKLWLVRNKISRLNDNLKLFKAICE